MFRFLTTLMVTLAAIVGATAWWTGGDPPRSEPTPEGMREAPEDMRDAPEEAREAPAAAPLAEPAPARRTAPAPGPATPPAALARTLPPIPAPPVARPLPRVAARPGPATARVADRVLPGIPEPVVGAETVEETELPDSPFFEPMMEPAFEPVAEPAEPGDSPAEPFERLAESEAWPEPEDAVALRRDHDASASRIRRLLDVYDELGRRR